MKACPRPLLPLSRALGAVLLLTVLAGCHKKGEMAATPAPAPKRPALLTDVDLKGYKPNEAGAVMIVMFHRFDAREPNRDLNRTPDQFRKDLEDLYKRGYRPVTVSEIVENRMDVPAGKTPIALTFDDALPTQFRIITGADGRPHIDPDCAVGIMETFSKAHPDWPTRGTFFVLPKEGRNGDPFGQAEFVQDKFAYLVKHGYEIGNHTSTHPASMRQISAERVRWELATAVRDIRQAEPDAKVQCFAIPYGKVPRSEDARKAMLSGAEGSTQYANKAVLMAAWRPVASPVCKIGKKVSDQIAAYNPFHLERVLPDPRQATKPGTLEYWLKYFDQNPGERYVSDGNPQVVAVPKAFQSRVDTARVKAQGKVVQFYSLTGGGGNGDSLSVE